MRVVIVVALLAIGHTSARADLVAIDWFGDLYDIDIATGRATWIGFTGFPGTNSLAQDDSGTLFAVVERALITVDPGSGIGELIVPLNRGDIRGLAFSPSGELFDIRASGRRRLDRINLSNGNVNEVGIIGDINLQGMDFGPDGLIFAQGGDAFVAIEPANARVSIIDPNPTVHLQSLVFVPDGRLFGISNEALFLVDVETGATTLIGEFGLGLDEVRGIEYVVPEPTGLAVLTLGALCMLGRRRAARSVT